MRSFLIAAFGGERSIELADFMRDDFLYTKEMLLEPAPITGVIPTSSIGTIKREPATTAH